MNAADQRDGTEPRSRREDDSVLFANADYASSSRETDERPVSGTAVVQQ